MVQKRYKTYILLTLCAIGAKGISPSEETPNEASSVEVENRFIDDVAGLDASNGKAKDNAAEIDAKSADDNDMEKTEAESKVAAQLENLRRIASRGVVNVLKKLDDILDRREKLNLPLDPSEDSSTTSSSESNASASSKRSDSTTSLRDAKERLKLASAEKLKTELEALVDDALDLVGEKLRHLKTASTTLDATSADDDSSAESATEEMKDLLRKLEEKDGRRQRKKSHGDYVEE